jgi:hypothetical protein
MSKLRGMEAVASKSARKPLLKRKDGSPSMVISVKSAPTPVERAKDEDEARDDDALECPKCGMQLADTPENREYISSKSGDSSTEDEPDEDEDEDEY